jgi:DNA-binding response OmpR family regulator
VGTVLVIDDEKAITDMLHRALTRFGFEVLVAVGGEQGVALFDQFHIDVVLTDVMMPRFGGVEVVNHIRRSDKKKTPVIAMSGTPALLGTHDFDLILPKPFSIYELLAHLRRVFPEGVGPNSAGHN